VLGDLFMNPGGPGASGVQFLEEAGTTFPAALRASFNLVSWDPRGVGQSDPVTCASAAENRRLIELDPAPATPSQVAKVVTATKQYVAGCEARTSRKLLENVSSVDTARDLDELRAALGQPKLDYLGFSYGTYIGELYAKLYPSHIRAMVLDGAIDPALSTVGEETAQAKGFEIDLNDFFRYCNTNATCKKELPGGAAKDYNKIFAQFANGATVLADFKALYGGVQSVGLGVAEIGVISALYSTQTWPDLARALSEIEQGNGNLIAALAYSYEGLQSNGTFSNEDAANVAINCVDRPSPKSLPAYEALAHRLASVAPDFGAATAWGSLACAYWPVPPQGRPTPIHAPGTPKIIVVGSTGDPATPYAWAKAVSAQLDNAELLTRNGPGHTGYFSSSCIRSYVDNYFETLALPPTGTVCASG
jgi:pimeloyl-ACP methyl ester carboxylesterase